jgi:hypothetical protein
VCGVRCSSSLSNPIVIATSACDNKVGSDSRRRSTTTIEYQTVIPGATGPGKSYQEKEG